MTMTREQMIQILSHVLTNNVGQKLTLELATGIATVVNQALQEAERQPVEGSQS